MDSHGNQQPLSAGNHAPIKIHFQAVKKFAALRERKIVFVVFILVAIVKLYPDLRGLGGLGHSRRPSITWMGGPPSCGRGGGTAGGNGGGVLVRFHVW